MKIPSEIVVFGLAKSGTTGALFKIRNSLREMGLTTHLLFEPKCWENPVEVKPGDVLLGKVLVGSRDYADYDSFERVEKKILITRDPRDRLVSYLIYNIFEIPPQSPMEEVNAFLRLVEKKIARPHEVTLRKLLWREIRLLFPEYAGRSPDYPPPSRIESYVTEGIGWHERIQDQFPDAYQFRYEDFIADRTEGLAEFLGFPLNGNAVADPPFNRVARSLSSGAWRHWMTPDDRDWLRPLMAPALERMGVGPDDWEIAANPVIRADTSLDYMQELLTMRSERLNRGE